jgi:hypothetical protein
MFNTMSIDAINPGWLGFILFCWFFFIPHAMPRTAPLCTADNIQLVYKRVNLGKSKFSDEEFRV